MNLRKKTDYLLKIAFPSFQLFICNGIGALLLLAQPFVYKVIYEQLIPTYDKELLTSILFGIASVLLLSSLINLLTDILTTHIRGKLISLIRNDVTNEIINYRYAFFRRMDIGDLVQRIIPEIDTLSFTIASCVKAIGFIMQLGLILIIALLYNYVFFLISLFLLTLYIVWHSIFKKPIEKYTSRSQALQGEIYGYFFEHLQNIKIIKLFNIYDDVLDKLNIQLRALKAYSLSNTFFRALLSIATRFLDIAIIGLAVYSMYRITSGNMTIGFYLVFSILITSLVTPVDFLINMGNQIESGRIALKRIKDIINGEKEISGKMKIYKLADSIEFKNVEFSYDNSRQVLSGLTFEIEKGSMVAFVGASGSGKSTIVQLLTRLYDPSKGLISIDHNPIQNFDLISLRDYIGVLSQDFFLFNDTVKNNIDPKERLKNSYIEEILDNADMSDFKKRLDYCIGEGGWNLSGGERQRISIARLLARAPGILILDEATSNLDPHTEKIILNNIKLLKINNPDLTIIMVTHRVSHLSEMDRVYLVDDGKINDQGLHKDLMCHNSKYSTVLQALNNAN